MVSNTWLGKFPKLGIRANDEQSAYLNQTIDPDSPQFEITLNSVAEIIFTVFNEDSTNFGEIFPNVQNGLRVDDADFDTRVRNVLRRNGYEFLGNVLRTNLPNVLKLQNMGQLSAIFLLRQLLRIEVLPAQFRADDNMLLKDESADEETVLELNSSLPSDEVLLGFTSGQAQALAATLNRLAVFDFYSRADESSLISFPASKVSKIDEQDTSDTITSKSWLDGVDLPSLTELCDEFIEPLDDSRRLIIEKRLAAKTPMTLDQVGELLGVTRERARQIQKSVTKGFEDHLDSRKIFRIATAALKNYLKTPLTKTRTLKNFPDLKRKTLARVTAYDFLVGLGVLEAREELVCADFTYFDELFAKAWDAVGTGGIFITEAALIDFLSVEGADVDVKSLSLYLVAEGYAKVSDCWFGYRGRGIIDVAQAVLAIQATPLTPVQIMGYLKEDTRTERSLQNAMASSPLFVRTSKIQWGLESWGVEPYETIRGSIQSHLDEFGSVQLDVLEKTLANKFGVSRKSVAAYAQSYPFKVVDGWVSNSSVQPIGSKSVESTKKLYFTSSGISIRIVINAEILRGSSPSAPKALCSWLGIRAGEALELASDWGKFTVSNVSFMANMTSIKKLCDQLGLGEGDELLLSFDRESVVCRPIRSQGAPEAYLRDVFSVQPEGIILQAAIAALRLEANSGWADVKQALDKRKEFDLVQVIESLKIDSD